MFKKVNMEIFDSLETTTAKFNGINDTSTKAECHDLESWKLNVAYFDQ